MKPIIVCALLMFMTMGTVTVVEPLYPPNAAAGGTVVVACTISKGAVREIKTLFGEEPFTGSTRQALKKWRFQKDLDEGSVLVVVNFRGPNFYATGSAHQKLCPAKADPGLPVPTAVVEPNYPPNSLGEGGVVLLLHVSEKGSVEKAEEVKGAGILTSASIEAVKQWQFEPARNADGEKVPSKAYAVCVFRRPVIGGR